MNISNNCNKELGDGGDVAANCGSILQRDDDLLLCDEKVNLLEGRCKETMAFGRPPKTGMPMKVVLRNKLKKGKPSVAGKDVNRRSLVIKPKKVKSTYVFARQSLPNFVRTITGTTCSGLDGKRSFFCKRIYDKNIFKLSMVR